MLFVAIDSFVIFILSLLDSYFCLLTNIVCADPVNNFLEIRHVHFH